MPEISPFSEFANFTGTFTVAGAGLVQDELGNFRPNTATIVVVAMMEEVSLAQQYRRPRDLDERSTYIGGYIVTPRPLPLLITPDSRCTAVYNGLTGTFIYEYTARNPFLQALDIDIVDVFKGWFVPTSFVPLPL